MAKSPPIMTSPAETAEIARLRDLVAKALGSSDFELVGLDADKDGGLVGKFRKKANNADRT